LRHRSHHSVVHGVRGGTHGGRLEETLVDAEIIRRKHSGRGGRIFHRDLHVHGSVSVDVLVRGQVNGVEVSEEVLFLASRSAFIRTIGGVGLEDLSGYSLLRLLERNIVVRCWGPEVGDEIFEVPGVSPSDVLEENLISVVRISESGFPAVGHIEAVHVVHAAVHVHVQSHVHVHVVIQVVSDTVVVKDTGQRLFGECRQVDMIGVLLVVAVGIVVINNAHHDALCCNSVS